MKYKCPQCDYTSDKPGTCPMHNVPLEETKEGKEMESEIEETEGEEETE